MRSKDSLPEYLSVAEAAWRLRVDRRTIRKALAAGELPFVRLGRTIRIPRAALDARSAA